MNTWSNKKKWALLSPQIIFYNTVEKNETVNDGKASVTIAKEGGYEHAPTNQLLSSCVFRGSENPITTSRVYKEDFLCAFDMGHYPFDTQSCSVDLVIKGNIGSFVELVPGNLRYAGKKKLDMYVVQDVALDKFMDSRGVEGLRVDLVFSRRLFAIVLATYLPTGLICIVCFATNYFYSFEAAVTVNLTCLLVLTTIFIGVANSLPTTAYIKLVDLWLLFTLMVPLVEVFLHTYSHYRCAGGRGAAHGVCSTGVDRDGGRVTMAHVSVRRKQRNQEAYRRRICQEQESRDETGDQGGGESKVVGKFSRLWSDISAPEDRGLIIVEYTSRWLLPTIFIVFTIAYFTAGLCLLYD